jgi:hypothetical protein
LWISFMAEIRGLMFHRSSILPSHSPYSTQQLRASDFQRPI